MFEDKADLAITCRCGLNFIGVNSFYGHKSQHPACRDSKEKKILQEREKCKRYYHRYHEAQKARVLAYSRANKQAIAKQQKEKFAADPWYARVLGFVARANDRAKFYGLPERLHIKDFSGWSPEPCAYCGADGDTWDHVIALSQGGSNSVSNLVPCCLACNRKKNCFSPDLVGMTLNDKYKHVAATERQFQRQILELAQLLQWTPYFTWNSIHSPAGFPDLVLVRDRLIMAELKSDTGKVTVDQRRWMDLLIAANVETYLWRPSQWDEVVATLTRRGHARTPQGIQIQDTATHR